MSHFDEPDAEALPLLVTTTRAAGLLSLALLSGLAILTIRQLYLLLPLSLRELLQRLDQSTADFINRHLVLCHCGTSAMTACLVTLYMQRNSSGGTVSDYGPPVTEYISVTAINCDITKMFAVPMESPAFMDTMESIMNEYPRVKLNWEPTTTPSTNVAIPTPSL